MRNKCQTGMEFLIISATVFFLFVIFFVAVQKNTEEKNKEKEKLIVTNLALSIQDEINLAKDASNGYIREFNVPDRILGRDYEISIIKNSIYNIYIKTSKVAISLTIDKVTGEIKKGKNIIKKENGETYLN